MQVPQQTLQANSKFAGKSQHPAAEFRSFEPVRQTDRPLTKKNLRNPLRECVRDHSRRDDWDLGRSADFGDDSRFHIDSESVSKAIQAQFAFRAGYFGHGEKLSGSINQAGSLDLRDEVR